MNIKTLLLVVFSSCAFQLYAQTNSPPVDNFVLVTNLWYQGSKSNVLAIAEQRLAANPNDLAGLVLKMEYDFSFLSFSSISILSELGPIVATIFVFLINVHPNLLIIIV